MTAEIKLNGGQLEISDQKGEIRGKHASQLNFWSFRFDAQNRTFSGPSSDPCSLLGKVVAYFTRHEIPYVLSAELIEIQAEGSNSERELQKARVDGGLFKAGHTLAGDAAPFLEFVETAIPRTLKSHQVKAALHLLAVRNGANFSVPGSGKTTVALTVYAWLKHLGEVNALVVVGPPSCFGPWQTEFESVFGRHPSTEIFAGGDVGERRERYLVRGAIKDLYLTSFQTLQNDCERVKYWFKQAGLKVYFVVDEAHYIKQLGGAWATSVLDVCPNAKRRCVLSGTPFPRSYSDAFNLFDALWPSCPPLTPDDKTRIELYSQRKREDEAVAVLDREIGALFYRVRKSDLGLAAQQFHPPIIVPMKKFERIAFDALTQSTRDISKEDHKRNFDTLERLRRGRMMRLRQSVSYAKLLGSAVADYPENLLEGDLSLADIIRHYDELETPNKLDALMELVAGLRARGEKVLIWSNFIATLKLILQRLREAGHGSQLIYGDTPTEESSARDELTRQEIISDFQSKDSGTDILVANPAACAESVSLHKACSHAVYYDLSYNCAQYLQSLDRIHRVGGSEEIPSHYYFLQYAETIDDDILTNVRRKAQRMSAVIDQEYPVYSLDMFSVDEELEAYERLFK